MKYHVDCTASTSQHEQDRTDRESTCMSWESSRSLSGSVMHPMLVLFRTKRFLVKEGICGDSRRVLTASSGLGRLTHTTAVPTV